MKYIFNIKTLLIISTISIISCGTEFLEVESKGTQLESNFYQTEDEIYQGLVAVYDVLQWGGTNGWTMKLGLMNAASDDTYAGGSDASDQPSWVAFDNFTIDPFLGPQSGLWNKHYSGIYRANLIMEKVALLETASPEFKARVTAEAKFLRAFFYFDQVRLFGPSPLIDHVLSGDELYAQKQASVEEIYGLIEQDLKDARATFELPSTVPVEELGRVTKGAVNALLGKVILFQNDESRMAECAGIFEEVIGSGLYQLEENFGDIFALSNEFGVESVFEIQHSGAARAGWDRFANGSEGLYEVQFFGMRDYVGPDFAVGWSFCPVTEKLQELMKFDPRYEHTIIDAKKLKAQGASFTEGYQNTDYFIRKYAGLQDEVALDGEIALNWGTNVREIRYADVLLMAAEAYARSGDDGTARGYLNEVRRRVSIQPVTSASGQTLLDAIYRERQFELATEGHRFFDLVRTGRAADALGDQGFKEGINEVLPIPQTEIDIAVGNLIQNTGY